MLRTAGAAALLLSYYGPALGDVDCRTEASPCRLDEGVYYTVLPAEHDGLPWVLYLHGFGGSAASMAENQQIVEVYLDRGYSLILPQALPFLPNEPAEWSIRDEWKEPRDWSYPRDDVAFLRNVIEDAVTRFGLDRSRGLIAGFSTGGSMVWDLACLAPETALAYAPIGGGFWETMTDSCAGPVHLLHTHGFSDTVVPLEGRQIEAENYGLIRQADIYAGLALWRETMGCNPNADEHEISDDFWRKRWTECAAGSLEFVLYPAGHRVPEQWPNLALDWFEALMIDG